MWYWGFSVHVVLKQFQVSIIILVADDVVPTGLCEVWPIQPSERGQNKTWATTTSARTFCFICRTQQSEMQSSSEKCRKAWNHHFIVIMDKHFVSAMPVFQGACYELFILSHVSDSPYCPRRSFCGRESFGFQSCRDVGEVRQADEFLTCTSISSFFSQLSVYYSSLRWSLCLKAQPDPNICNQRRVSFLHDPCCWPFGKSSQWLSAATPSTWSVKDTSQLLSPVLV